MAEDDDDIFITQNSFSHNTSVESVDSETAQQCALNLLNLDTPTLFNPTTSDVRRLAEADTNAPAAAQRPCSRTYPTKSLSLPVKRKVNGMMSAKAADSGKNLWLKQKLKKKAVKGKFTHACVFLMFITKYTITINRQL